MEEEDFHPEHGPIGYVYCCREWPVFILWQVRRCGYCGKVPQPLQEDKEGTE